MARYKDDVLGHAVLAADDLRVETVALLVALKSWVDHERETCCSTRAVLGADRRGF